MKTNKDLINFYEGYNENGRLVSRHGMVEYLTTMKYIEKYLKPHMRVLEIGAATGRYSHALAQKGYRVDAVELIEHNIELFKQNTIEGELVTITQGNALDLSAFMSDTYDITLLLGPMYHLFTTEEQLQALSEAIRVTKKGGIVFAWAMQASCPTALSAEKSTTSSKNVCWTQKRSTPSKNRGMFLNCIEQKILTDSVLHLMSPSFILLLRTAIQIICGKRSTRWTSKCTNYT